MEAFTDVYTEYNGTSLAYEFITELQPGIWKVSRKHDRMEYLAQDVTHMLFADADSREMTPEGELMSPDGHNILQQVKIVLNHPNLVSLVDCFAMQLSSSGKGYRERWYTVWDYCDAGNLGNLLVPSTPRPQDRPMDDDVEMDIDTDRAKDRKKKGHLPESLCWHVLTSVLRALAWLHDGVREVVENEDGIWERRYENLDWQPMLHRDITPQNIFMSHPRRREWYGPVKLGNYGSLVVSGHCQTRGDTHVPTSTKALAPPPGRHFVSLEDLIAWDSTHGSVYPHQAGQPYTMVSEYRALGEILQAMMVEPTSIDHVESMRSRSVVGNLRDATYTARLKNLVVKLMEFDPWAELQNAKRTAPAYATSNLYCEALQGVKWFLNSGKGEADAFVTEDIAERENYLENTILKGQQLLDSYVNVRDILEQLT
ncbi:hypothetical protein GGS20DRAFT_550379 [Poronia punctata]|nr:hypothetical protein GGS20DRAFT_550379 [Poronia punctata]